MANTTKFLSTTGFADKSRKAVYNLFLQLTGVEAGATSTHYVVRNSTGSIRIDTVGTGFTYANGFAVSGTYTSSTIYINNVAIASYTLSPGINIASLNSAISQYSSTGSTAALDALYSQAPSTINGSSGNDYLYGQNNADTINGNAGRDVMFGGGGNDTLNAGATALDANGFGFDMATGDAGADTFNVGSSGPPYFIVNYALETGPAAISVNLATNSAKDTFGNTDVLNGITFVIATNRNDTLIGDSTADFFAPGGGRDTIDGGAGIDELDYYFIKQFNSDAFGWAKGITVTTTADNAGTVMDPFNFVDTFTNVERIAGTRFADKFNGSAFADGFIGGDGADTFNGGAGIDDVLYSQETVGGGTAGITVTLTGGAGTVIDPYGKTDTLSSIERIFGTPVGDKMTGDGLANSFFGYGGADTLIGGAGADNLNGGLGSDTLTGGTGADSFLFDTGLSASNVDIITDYVATDDTIKLENFVFKAFAAVPTNTTLTSGFRWGAGATTANSASNLLIYNITTGDLYYDADGSGTVAAAIKFATLSTRPTLTVADFVIL